MSYCHDATEGVCSFILYILVPYRAAFAERERGCCSRLIARPRYVSAAPSPSLAARPEGEAPEAETAVEAQPSPLSSRGPWAAHHRLLLTVSPLSLFPHDARACGAASALSQHPSHLSLSRLIPMPPQEKAHALPPLRRVPAPPLLRQAALNRLRRGQPKGRQAQGGAAAAGG